jgi:nucleoside-diphosphate-sugar epimerase
MRIFLTGGTGFIGSHFINQAIKMGHEIIALRRANSKSRAILKFQPMWIEGSMDGSYDRVFKDIEVFVHLAAHSVNYPYDTLENCMYWNLNAPLRLASQAAQQGVKRFMIAGSCFEYGKSAERFAELTVNSPLEPDNNYSISKAASSVAFLGLAHQLGLQLSLLRIFQVYGEGEHETRLWPSLKKAALEEADFRMTQGGQVRDFISVQNTVEFLLRDIMESRINIIYPVVKHVATGIPQRTIDFASYWWKEWGARGKIIAGALPYRDKEMMRIISSRNSIF